jgi:hypothetical protein
MKSDPSARLLESLEAMRESVTSATARILALEQAVMALVHTHPDPALAQAALEKLLEYDAVRDLNSNLPENLVHAFGRQRELLLENLARARNKV